MYKNSWKEFVQLKNIDAKFYASDYYDVNVNKYGIKRGTSIKFWENKGCINIIHPYGWFQWYFRYWVEEDPNIIKDKLIDEKSCE